MNPFAVTKLKGLAKQDLFLYPYFMFYVYVLKSEKDGRLYKGICNDLEKRVKQHNLGQNKSTKGFRPWVLVHHEIFETRIGARDREKFFKSGSGREYLKGLLGL